MPRKAVEGGAKRVALNMKTTPDVRSMLEKAAQKSGRSLTAETEWRLAMSFEWERAFGEFQAWKASLKKIQKDTEDANRRRDGQKRLARGLNPDGSLKYSWVRLAPGSEQGGFQEPEAFDAIKTAVAEVFVTIGKPLIAEALAESGITAPKTNTKNVS